jgi:hypothetical protein
MIITNAVSLLQFINLMKFFYSSGDPATIPAPGHRRGLRNRHASQIPSKTGCLVFEIWLSIRRKGFTKETPIWIRIRIRIQIRNDLKCWIRIRIDSSVDPRNTGLKWA